MKNIISFCFLILISASLLAQNESQLSQNIQLTDGSVLKGKIIKTDTENNLVYIQLDSGGEMTIPANTVVQSKQQKGGFGRLANGKAIKNKGFFLLPQMYSLSARRAKSWDDSNDIRHAAGTSITAGYHLKNYLAIGGGVGIDLYENLLMPVFVDIRGNIGKGNITPYYALDIGYGFPLSEWLESDDNFSNEVKGGKFIYPAIGLKFASRNALAFQMDLGYNFQQNERNLSNWWGSNTIEKIWYKSFAIRAGISF